MTKKSDKSLFINFFFNSLKNRIIDSFFGSLFTIHYKKGHYSLIIIPNPDPHLWNLVGNRSKLEEISKIMHGLALSYLLDLIPSIDGQTNNFAFRNADHIQGFRSNSNLFSDSYFQSTIKATLSYILLTLVGKDDMSRSPIHVRHITR